MMEILSELQIVERLENRQPFTARAENGGFEICVTRYLPMVVTAIHDGYEVTTGLAEQMKVTDEQRRFEEDPYTASVADAFDISIRGRDSRYCCDLNRSPERCIYEEAWGRQVWKTPLQDFEKERLLERHAAYYRVLDGLLTVLTEDFGSAVLYDLHSYNYIRLNGEPPLFNVGSHFMNLQRFGAVVDHLVGKLAAIELPGCDNRAAMDEVFEGTGYQAEFVHRHHPDVLCVPLEIKKVFMDEASLKLRKTIFTPLREQLIGAVMSNYNCFRALIGENTG